MAEFFYTEEIAIKEGEPIVFENHTDFDFSVSAGIVFRKSGLYRVTVDGSHVMVSKEPESKKGKWVRYDGDRLKTMCKCSECGAMIDINEKYRNFFCYHCGARMEENNESD